MTKELAINVLKSHYHKNPRTSYSLMVKQATEMAIEELQERKTGKWKEVYAETDYRYGWIEFSCEFCEYQHGLESGEYGWSYGEPIPWKYCPICGAKMEADE